MCALVAIYGTTIIATSDNLVRAHLIGNQARLHPLVSLVTVLGALKLTGLWGIFVGPMVAAFFFALLNIAHERFAQQNAEQSETADQPDQREAPAYKHSRVPVSIATAAGPLPLYGTCRIFTLASRLMSSPARCGPPILPLDA